MDEDRCNTIFSTILNGCDTSTTIAKHGGTLSDQCASFNLTVETSNKLNCIDPRDAPGGYSYFSVTDATAAIKTFCSAKGRFLDPNDSQLGPGGFCQFCANTLPNYVEEVGNVSLNISVSFGSDPSCPTPKRFNITDVQSDCENCLLQTVNGCEYSLSTMIHLAETRSLVYAALTLNTR